MTRYAVALGSNQGDRAGHLRSALDEMGELGHLRAVSGLYETDPVGGPAQGPYLNAVALLDSSHSPHELLRGLQRIEAAHGRVRYVPWGPRTLDLDIVAMEGARVDTDDLVIPHPRAAERRFVLEPLAEIWPQAPVGVSSTAEEELGSVIDQEVDLLAADWADPPTAGRYWVVAQVAWLGAIAIGIVGDGSLPGAGAHPARWIGAALAVAGAALAAAAVRTLGDALTIMPEPVPGARLVDQGVYARARHPIYGGVSLVMLGVSLALASVSGTLLSLGLLPFFFAKAGYEERRLRIAYQGYREYRDRVRHRMIPYLL